MCEKTFSKEANPMLGSLDFLISIEPFGPTPLRSAKIPPFTVFDLRCIFSMSDRFCRCVDEFGRTVGRVVMNEWQLIFR